MSYISWYLEKNREHPEGFYDFVVTMIDLLKASVKYKVWIALFTIIYVVLFFNLSRLFPHSVYDNERIAYCIVVGMFTVGVLSVFWIFKETIFRSYMQYIKIKDKG